MAHDTTKSAQMADDEAAEVTTELFIERMKGTLLYRPKKDHPFGYFRMFC